MTIEFKSFNEWLGWHSEVVKTTRLRSRDVHYLRRSEKHHIYEVLEELEIAVARYVKEESIIGFSAKYVLKRKYGQCWWQVDIIDEVGWENEVETA